MNILKNKVLLLFALLCILLLFRCMQNDPAEEKEAVLQVLKDQVDAWNQFDLEGFMEGYWKSDSLRFSSGGNVRYGWQATMDGYRQGYPDPSVMGKLTFSELDVKIIGDRSAMVFGKWELARKTDHPWGRFTLIWKKFDEGWRIIHDHTSSARNE
jgi:uncharacterized protein (TIGR02246 family)